MGLALSFQLLPKSFGMCRCVGQRDILSRMPLPPPPPQERGREVARGGVGTQTQKGQRLSTEALTAAPGDQQMAGCGRRFGSREGGAGRSTSRHACVPQGAPARVRARPAGSTSLGRAPIAPQSLAPPSLARVLPPAWAPQLRRQRPSDPDENFPLIRPRPPLASVYPCTIKESDLALKGLDPTLIHQTLRKT